MVTDSVISFQFQVVCCPWFLWLHTIIFSSCPWPVWLQIVNFFSLKSSVILGYYGYTLCYFFPVSSCLLFLVSMITDSVISFQSRVVCCSWFLWLQTLLFLSSYKLSVVPGFYGYTLCYFFPVTSCLLFLVSMVTHSVISFQSQVVCCSWFLWLHTLLFLSSLESFTSRREKGTSIPFISSCTGPKMKS